MEKKPEDFYRSVSGVVLRKSDFRSIVDMIATNGLTAAIETDTHRAKDLEDFLSSKESFRKVLILRQAGTSKVIFRHLMVQVEAHRAWVRINGGDLGDIGIGTTIVDLFLKRRRFLRPNPTHILWTLLASCLIGGAFTVFKNEIGPYPHVAKAVSFTMVALFLFAIGTLAVRKLQGDFVTFRAELGEGKPINWRAAGWDVVKILLGGLVGAGITLLVKK